MKRGPCSSVQYALISARSVPTGNRASQTTLYIGAPFTMRPAKRLEPPPCRTGFLPLNDGIDCVDSFAMASGERGGPDLRRHRVDGCRRGQEQRRQVGSAEHDAAA